MLGPADPTAMTGVQQISGFGRNDVDLGLDGQGVLVCGAASGIGAAIASRFAQEGCRVVGMDVQEPSPGSGAADYSFVRGDVTAIDDVRRVAETFPDLRHIVYSVGAGAGTMGFPFWNVDPAAWGRVIEVNLIGAVNVAHVFAPELAERRHGTFLFLVSVAGQIGSQTDPPYSAAKAGLINFTQCAAKDLAPHNVRVNALSPGMVKTPLNRSVWAAGQAALPAEQRQSYEAWTDEKIRRVSPLGRWQTSEDCAAVAVFLSSEQAKNITGQTINVDGGQVMHA